MGSFERFSEEKFPDKECFYCFVKDGSTGDSGEKLDCQISNEDYLTATKFGINLTWTIWVVLTIII